jgi:dipeptidyl aminopeptidase/acylaminoacyl peptidase
MDRRLFTLIEIAVIAGLVLAVLYFGGVFGTGPDPTRTLPATLAPVQSTRTPGPSLTPVASPTSPPLTRPAGLIAFESTRDGNHEIYLMNADGSSPRNLTRHPADDYFPVWSPDGRLLAFLSTRSGYLEIYLMQADGSGVRQLTRSQGSNMAYLPLLAWAPDSSRIVAARTDPWAFRDVRKPIAIDLLSTGCCEIAPPLTIYQNEAGLVEKLDWSPDGSYVAAALAVPFEYRAWVSQVDDAPSLRAGAFVPLGERCTRFAWTPASRLACFEPATGLSVMKPDGTGAQITFPSIQVGYIQEMVWSPDGKNLVSVDSAPSQRIRLMVTDGPTPRDPIAVRDPHFGTLPGGLSPSLSWSPDSQWIAYDSIEQERVDIYIVNVFGPDGPIRLTRDSGSNYGPRWQPQPAAD